MKLELQKASWEASLIKRLPKLCCNQRFKIGHNEDGTLVV